MQFSEFEALEWDDQWDQLVREILAADHNLDQWDGEKMQEGDRLSRAFEKAQDKHEKYAIEYPICKLHAERLLANLREKFPQFEFAAHEETLDGGWVLLARRPNKKPPTPAQRDKLELVASKIMGAVEKKYPAEKSKPRKPITPAKKPSGCGCMLLLISLPLGTGGILVALRCLA